MRILICLFIFAQSALAMNFTIDSFEVDCKGYQCEKYANKLNTIVNSENSEKALRRNLKFLLNSPVLKNISYIVYEENKKTILKVSYSVKPVIQSVRTKVKGDVDYSFIDEMIDVGEGQVFDLTRLKNTVNTIRKSLETEGIVSSKVTYQYENNDGLIKLILNVNSGRYLKVRDVRLRSENLALKEFITNKTRFMIDNDYKISSFKEHLNNIMIDLKSSGYYNIDISYTAYRISEREVILALEIKNDDLYSLNIQNHNYFSKTELKKYIKEVVTRYKDKTDVEKIKQKLEELYRSKGFYSPTFDIGLSTHYNRFQEKITHIKLSIEEGERTKIRKVRFRGNYFFSQENLTDLFYDNATDMVSSKYFQEKYINDYLKLLKEEYLINGFVLVGTSKPRITYSKDKSYADVLYIIKEGPRAFVEEIKFQGIESSLNSGLSRQMTNKLEAEFNPLAMQDDLTKVLKYVKEQGYYYAKYDETKKIVSYQDNYSRVYINIPIVKGIKKKINEVIVIGNTKTKRRFIDHVSKIERGHLLTPSYVTNIQKKLISTGAFKAVRVFPDTSNNEYVDLIINIEEKSAGNYELVPGIRTDIGPKVKVGINWFNHGGVNRTFNMSVQTNQRIDLTSIESERQDKNKSLLEGSFKFNWNEPYLAWSEYNYSMSLSLSRLRYFSFDADIQRIVNGLQRSFDDNWSLSLKLKNENIHQFNGTDETDEGNFVVGSLLPGLVADFRDNRVNPMKGNYHELTVEYATPFLGSSDDISFATTISKNRLYFPIGKRVTIAFSGTMGVQKNLTSDGSIPSIKVFRLRGLETVRGFNEAEINTLINGNDINDEVVDDTAFMANFKLEPRYLLTDNLMLGVFLDAGRVFYEELELSELRKSVGLSFKYLTPVGSINFDYGHKLLRKEDSSGTLESPGRFHISIGFF